MYWMQVTLDSVKWEQWLFLLRRICGAKYSPHSLLSTDVIIVVISMPMGRGRQDMFILYSETITA